MVFHRFFKCFFVLGNMVNYTRKVVGGAGFILIFSLIGSVFAYFSRVFLARNLSLEEFGLFFAVLAMFNFLGLFKDFGLGQSMVKYISMFNADKLYNKVKTTIIISGAIQLGLTLIVTLLILGYAESLECAGYYFSNICRPTILLHIFIKGFLKKCIVFYIPNSILFIQSWNYESCLCLVDN